MSKRFILTFFTVILLTTALFSQKQKPRHTFSLGTTEFLLDGNSFQIISGEMHPSRIPADILASQDPDGKGYGMQYDKCLYNVELPRTAGGCF